MPTESFPPNRTSAPASPTAQADTARRIVICAGHVSVRAELLATPTAARIWAALPIHSSAETWGHVLQFEIPIESGRERDACVLATAGDLYFWSENDRILIPFGRTPISRPGEMRLPSPCNVWATAVDPVTPLNAVTPGEKVSMTAAEK